MSPVDGCIGLLMSIASVAAWGQSQHVLCDRGSGSLDTSFAEVRVHVGAVKSGAFATRVCETTLHWRHHEEVVVERAEQVDIDVLGADLGMGVPVAAFVVRPAADDWRQNYEVWSVDQKPRKLLTLEGEDTFSAVDAEANGFVAIWTTDASAVEGFDGLNHVDLASPPEVVLRLGREGLQDVSAWYRPKYDRQITELRRSLMPGELEDFRKSSGQPNDQPMQAQQAVRLRKTKATVLEIVWAYLYSGRPEQAWTELSNSWPAEDVPRVKAAIVKARSNGLEARVTKVVVTPPPKWTRKVKNLSISRRRFEGGRPSVGIRGGRIEWDPGSVREGSGFQGLREYLGTGADLIVEAAAVGGRI